MTIVNWLKGHRKQALTHTFVVVGFVLLVIFVAEPLFDSLERIPGEAQLRRLDLPSETGGMLSHLDEFKTDGRTTVEVRGWAFIEGEDPEGSEIYLVLASDRRTYVFDTYSDERPDVTAHFEELGLNLDYSGFNALLPARKIAGGEYTVGIYIRKGDIEALQYTSKHVVKSRGTIELSG